MRTVPDCDEVAPRSPCGDAPAGSAVGRRRIGRGACLAARSCAGLSEPTGAGDRHHRARRAGRHHRAARRGQAHGESRPVVLHREHAGRRRQHRHGGHRARRAGRLHDPRRHQQHRHQHQPLSENLLRSLQGLRSDFADVLVAARAGGPSVDSSRRPSTNWSRWRRRVPANSAMPRPAAARPRIWPANCSSWRSTSTSPTCRSTAAARRPHPRSAATCRSRCRRCRRR